MRFEINLGIKDDKLLLKTFRVWTQKVILAEVELEGVVVQIVLRPKSSISSVANVTSLVLVSTMCEQLVISIESYSTEATFWMPFEAALIYSSWIIVTELLVFPQVFFREQLMLVCENLLVSRAKVAHDFVMDRLDVTM